MQGTDLHVLVTEVARSATKQRKTTPSRRKNSRRIYVIYSRYLIFYHLFPLDPLFPRCLGASLTSPRPVLPFILTREHIVSLVSTNRGIWAANYRHPRTRRTARKRGVGDVVTQAFASRGCERITSDGDPACPRHLVREETRRRGSTRASRIHRYWRESRGWESASDPWQSTIETRAREGQSKGGRITCPPATPDRCPWRRRHRRRRSRLRRSARRSSAPRYPRWNPCLPDRPSLSISVFTHGVNNTCVDSHTTQPDTLSCRLKRPRSRRS